jgi:MFS transporter, DHA2 family, multidrug resistance protein
LATVATSAQQGTRRWWALIAIAVSVLVIGLDLTVLNLALPTLARDLHASTQDLQWFASAYSLVLAAVMLPAGLIGDRFGRKKVLMIALAVFGAASAACAYSASSGELIAARAVLGLGAAAVLPLSLSVLPVFFTEQERPKAIAIVMGATFLGYPAGPLLGGWLLDNFWWGSVFLINVPVVVLAVIAVGALLPESRSEHRAGLDLAGVLISSGGLAALTYGFIKAGQNGWGGTAAVATVAAGAALLAAFAGWEYLARRRARAQPLIELGLFRSAAFSAGTVLTTLVSFAMFGILFGMPQFFQDVQGVDALGTGVRLLPLIGGMVAGMLAGSRLQGSRGGAAEGAAPAGPAAGPRVATKVLVAAGFVVMAAGLAAGAFTRTSSGTGFAAAWFAVAGAGLGLATPTAMNAALGALSAERSGSGSALISAMRQVGATIGVAVLGTVISSSYQDRVNVGGFPAQVADAVKSSVGVGILAAHKLRSPALLGSVRSAYVHGLDVMLWTCAGIAVASALVALIFLPRASSPAAEDATGATGAPPVAERADEQAELSR